MTRPSLVAFVLVACTKPVPADDPSLGSIAAYDPLPEVDPFIGTGGIGFGTGSLTPAATRPFGMVHVGPDTRGPTGVPGFSHCSGYHYDDDHIDDFSHTHAMGMGVVDYGAIAVMPRAHFDATHTRGSVRSAPFDHATEEATPGWYAVTLEDDGTRVEIAATDRGAVHRYTFEAGAAPVLWFDLGHAIAQTEVAHADISVDSAGIVDGYQNLIGDYSARFGGLRTWFHAEVEPAPSGGGAWTDPLAPQDGLATASGASSGAWLAFPEGTTTVTLRLAISYVDNDGARGNFAEVAARSVDDVADEAADAWRAELGNVRVRGGTPEERRIFHTALYHAMVWPSRFDDDDGRYRGIDGEVHTTATPYYTDLSLWDTFRTLHPWLILARPDRQRDIAQSLVRMAEDGGSLPRWPLAHGYTGGMVGSPANQVLAETWLKGVEGWDVEGGYAAALAQATGPTANDSRGGIEAYRELGWVAADQNGGAASLTLEYAWNDFALARLAEALEKPEAEMLDAQSHHWQNTWDPDQAFFAGRNADGSFLPIENPLVWDPMYVEGDAWQYLWEVPQEADAMVVLQHGGDYDAFLERVDLFWEASYAEEDTPFMDTWYWHGNEPDVHYPYLGSLVGDLDRTVDPVVFVRESRYRDTPDGLDGNDDGGTLSAWYLFSALGFYPIAGTRDYVLGTPLFDRAEIDLPSGERFVIRAEGGAAGGPYVRAASLDGAALTAPRFAHPPAGEGVDLVFSLAPVPVGWDRDRSLSD